jgi:hypothetical protein
VYNKEHYVNNHIVKPDEQILALVDMAWQESATNLFDGDLILTSQRILVNGENRSLFAAIATRKKVLEFYFDQIASIEHSKGIALTTVKIATTGQQRFSCFTKSHSSANEFCDKANQRIAESKKKPAQPTLSSIDAIRELAKLKDAGILTEDEFERKKQELLARV